MTGDEAQPSPQMGENLGLKEAFAAARKTTDRARRTELYRSAIRTLLEDRVHLPAFTLHNTFGVKSRVTDFEPHPLPSVNPSLAGPNGVLTLEDG